MGTGFHPWRCASSSVQAARVTCRIAHHAHQHHPSLRVVSNTRQTHRNVHGSPAEGHTVAVRVGDRARLVDRPDLRGRVRTLREVEGLRGRAGDDALRGEAEVAVHDLAGHAGALGGIERSDVRGRSITGPGSDEACPREATLGREDER